MNLRVIQSCVQYAALFVGSALNADAVERICPLGACVCHGFVEVEALLFGVEIGACALNRHEAHAHLHFHLFTLGEVVGHVVAYVVASHVAAVARIQLVLALICVPLSLGVVQVGLFLPHSECCRLLVDAHYEVHGEYSLRIVAECAEQTGALKLSVAYTSQRRTYLVCESVAQVEQQVRLASGESIAFDRRAHCGSHLTLDAVFGQHVAVVARSCCLVLVFRAIAVVVDVQLACGRHCQQCAHFGTSHTAQRYVCKSGEIFIVVFVYR